MNGKSFFMATVAVFAALSAPVSATVITLDSTGSTGNPVVTNLATSGTAFALDALADGGNYTFHNIAALNDGVYGNANSWIGNGATGTSGPFAGINLNGSFYLDGFAFGRDLQGGYTDRSDGTYTIQVTTALSPDQTTLDSLWTTLDTVSVNGTAIRKVYSFDGPVLATGFRIIVPSTGVAIDEIELFGTAVPEPGTTALLGLGLLGVGLARRRRAH
ncbi:MAG: hypothetical protein ACJA13_004125 [Paraglaciecola sp.]|jgi:hypothetical protein